MTNTKYLAKVFIKTYSGSKRDKNIANQSISLPASNNEIARVLEEANKNVLLESLITETIWLDDEDQCFNALDTHGPANEILFQLNEFCKRLMDLSIDQKRKLHGAIITFSGITGPYGIGPWSPDLVYGVKLACIVDTIESINGVTNNFELGEFVIKNRLLPVIECVDAKAIALLDRERVAAKFKEKLSEEGKLGNHSFVNNGKSNGLNGFFYNMPSLEILSQTHTGKPQKPNIRIDYATKILVADKCCDGWEYKLVGVESESEFEYRVLKSRTRNAMVDYVGADDWNFSKDVEGLIDAAYMADEHNSPVPCYLFSSSEGNASFTKLYKTAELFYVNTYISDNDRIAHYADSEMQ